MLDINLPARKRASTRQTGQHASKSRMRFDSTAQAMPLRRPATQRVDTQYVKTQTRRSQQTASAQTDTAPLWSDQVKTRRKPQNRRSRARQNETPRPKFDWRAAFLSPLNQVAQSRWQTAAHVTINMLFLAAMGWLLLWFFIDDRFYIQHVEIRGNQRLSTQAVLAASGIQDYSIFWLNPADVTASLMRQLPPIKKAIVHYRLPNVVELEIQEQGGHVIWQLGERRYWVDDDGRLHPAVPDALAVIVVQDIRPGLYDRVDTQALIAAQEISRLMPDLKQIEYAPATGIRFTHPSGWLVYLGVGHDMARKINILHAMEAQFADPDKPQPSLIDLRYPDSPYYRMPQTESEAG